MVILITLFFSSGCIGRPIILTTNQFNLFRADEECNIENTYFVDAEVWNGRNWEKWLRNDFVYSSRNYWLYIAVSYVYIYFAFVQ